MGKLGAFKEIPKEHAPERAIDQRVHDYNEIYLQLSEQKLRDQGARCMDCGVPFCSHGCPLGNLMPEWNDLVCKGRYKEALDMLHRTNNFPEFTGRICPAPCEEACVLNINRQPVAIKLIEQEIVERGFREGWIRAQPPPQRTGRKVAVIGSGPAGLACAAQLNKAGHSVVVFERADRIGGLLVYGVPNFKLEKRIIERRVSLLREEGVAFVTKANVGANVQLQELKKEFNALALCIGASQARNLEVPGRELKGIYYAMQYLPQQTRIVLGDMLTEAESISANGKHVIILGGGDTGADCLGTALRQGCLSVCQFELLPQPPRERTAGMPWPYWPMIMRSSSAHQESERIQQNRDQDWPAKIRDFSINTKKFSGDNGRVQRLHAARLEWKKDLNGKIHMEEIPGSDFEMKCDLCLLALGFVHPEHQGPIEQLGLATDPSGNIKVDRNYMTGNPGVFAAGDARRGQSLVVWAISEGRQAARGVDTFLTGRSQLETIKLF